MKVSANIICIFCVSVILLIAVSSGLQLPGNFCKSDFISVDATTYRQAAELLYHHQFQAHAIRPFGYPLIIGFPMLFGASDIGVLVFAVILNIILWLGTIYLVYRIVSRLVTPRAGVLAAIVYILCISHEISLYQSLSETMFLFLIFVLLYFFLRYIYSRRTSYLLWMLGALCFSVVVRPVTYYFALFALAGCLILFLRQRNWRYLFVVIGLYAATMGLQVVNMHRTFGRYTQSFVQNYTLYAYLMCSAEFFNQNETASFSEFNAMRSARTDSIMISYKGNSNQNLLYGDDLYKAAIKENIAHNKSNIVKGLFINTLSNIEGSSPWLTLLETENTPGLESRINVLTKVTRWENKFFCYLGILCLPLFVILPFFRRYKPDGSYLFVAGVNIVFLYLLATSGISFWQGDRFTYILQPLVIVSAFFTGNVVLREIRAGFGRNAAVKNMHNPE